MRSVTKRTEGIIASALKAGDAYLWNGPVCPTCHHGYCGQHQCDPDVLDALADALHRQADTIRASSG